MLVLLELGAFMLVVSLLNSLNHFISYLSSWLLACYLLMVALCLLEAGAFMLVVSLLNLLNHVISYLSSWLLAYYLLMVSL
jgi:hypothetical protein